MNPKLETRLEHAATQIKKSDGMAPKQSIIRIMSLYMIVGLGTMTGAFSQDSPAERHQTPLPLNRVITSSDGRSMTGTITAVDGGVIWFRRESDGRTVVIPLANLSEANRKFVLTWDPPPNYRPSSVSISGSSTLARGSYPSRYQPRYSGGTRGPRGYRTYRQTCTGRTVVVPCR